MAEKERLKGGKPESYEMGIDPYTVGLDSLSPEEFKKVWDSCRPKLTPEMGTAIFCGTSGNTEDENNLSNLVLKTKAFTEEEAKDFETKWMEEMSKPNKIWYNSEEDGEPSINIVEDER